LEFARIGGIIGDMRGRSSRVKSEYERQQDLIFQELKDMEDIERRSGIQEKSAAESLAEICGLSKKELFDLYKPGMNGSQFVEALRAKRIKDDLKTLFRVLLAAAAIALAFAVAWKN
jgi:hypothetical protein